jgi:hypothetical protein
MAVRDYMQAFGDRADYIAALNMGRVGAGADNVEDVFGWWHGFTNGEGKQEGGKVRPAFLERGGREIVFPAMHSPTIWKVLPYRFTMAEAETARALTIADRMNVKRFNRECAVMFDSVRDLLGV